MSEELKNKYLSFIDYLKQEHWENFLNAKEKILLQSFREDIVDAYKLTNQEREAMMFINSIKINGEPLSIKIK